MYLPLSTIYSSKQVQSLVIEIISSCMDIHFMLGPISHAFWVWKFTLSIRNYQNQFVYASYGWQSVIKELHSVGNKYMYIADVVWKPFMINEFRWDLCMVTMHLSRIYRNFSKELNRKNGGGMHKKKMRTFF